MQPGNIVFFKEAGTSVNPKIPKARFVGHAYGILLGMVAPDQKDPPQDYITIQLGSLGLVPLDDVKEILGEAACAEVVRRFTAKYSERLNKLPRISILLPPEKKLDRTAPIGLPVPPART